MQATILFAPSPSYTVGILTPFPVGRNQKEDVFEYGTYFLESLGNCPLEAVQGMFAVFTFRIKVIMVSGATD